MGINFWTNPKGLQWLLKLLATSFINFSNIPSFSILWPLSHKHLISLVSWNSLKSHAMPIDVKIGVCTKRGQILKQHSVFEFIKEIQWLGKQKKPQKSTFIIFLYFIPLGHGKDIISCSDNYLKRFVYFQLKEYILKVNVITIQSVLQILLQSLTLPNIIPLSVFYAKHNQQTLGIHIRKVLSLMLVTISFQDKICSAVDLLFRKWYR